MGTSFRILAGGLGFPEGPVVLDGRFDSLPVEAGGHVPLAMCAMPGRAGISVVAPDGTLVEHAPMPDRSTTDLAFGGASRRIAHVTLSRTGRPAAVPWARPGLAALG